MIAATRLTILAAGAALLGLTACADAPADRGPGPVAAGCDTYGFVDANNDGLLDRHELGMGDERPRVGYSGRPGVLLPGEGIAGFYDCVDYGGGVGLVEGETPGGS
ncbi:hypothetical protein [Azospirillum halopraeferens]|uniref:hypothetical protein n=1 Tax=Azospirillum halopraeferens TaxID=34010 RepID=UPI0004023B8F|nr:hypothetical protein [Azospirillum halopraeferens]